MLDLGARCGGINFRMPSVRATSLLSAGFQAILPGDSHSIVTSGSSQVFAAFNARTSLIRLFATQDCFIQISMTPTAASTAVFFPGGFIEYFGISAGMQLAVIQSSVSGTLYVTEGY